MLKANKKTLIIASIVTLLPVLIGISFWSRLPDTMATHFGTNNQANGFSSKPVAVFGIPLLCLAVLWIGAVVTANDPRKQNISPKMFTLGLWIAPIVSLLGAALMYPVNLGYTVDITYVGGLAVGLLLIFVGNYAPKARQNYTIGCSDALPGAAARLDDRLRRRDRAPAVCLLLLAPRCKGPVKNKGGITA